MKRNLLGSFAIVGLLLAVPFGATYAADLPVKAMPPAPPPFTWGGLYAGFSLSWFESHDRWQYANPIPATLTPFTDTQDYAAWGVHGGAQWQFSQIVLGIEADYTNPDSVFRGATSIGTATSVCTSNLGQICQLRMSNISTVGGRAGWAFGDWLIFGQGGWASGTIETQLFNPNPGPTTDQSHNNDFRNGWYAGAGVNYAIWKSALMDVTIGADYRHIDLRTHFQPTALDNFLPAPPGINGRFVGGTADQLRFTVSLKTNGWDFMGPVVAKY